MDVLNSGHPIATHNALIDQSILISAHKCFTTHSSTFQALFVTCWISILLSDMKGKARREVRSSLYASLSVGEANGSRREKPSFPTGHSFKPVVSMLTSIYDGLGAVHQSCYHHPLRTDKIRDPILSGSFLVSPVLCVKRLCRCA